MTNEQPRFPDAVPLLKKLASSAWEDAKVSQNKIDTWLNNFTGECCGVDQERRHALHLLSQHLYFGKREIDECLKVLFNERIAYRYVQLNKNKLITQKELYESFKERLKTGTRFVGVGNPAESGTSFLYRFRQVNRLPVSVFSSLSDIIDLRKLPGNPEKIDLSLNPESLEHLVFIDDFCGSGDQVKSALENKIKILKEKKPSLIISYFLLFSTQSGLNSLQSTNLFNEVCSVITLDDDYKVFCKDSHYYRAKYSDISHADGEKIMAYYGNKIVRDSSVTFGYGNCQLLLSFEHNTPNNTLPVIWRERSDIPWHPIFPRINKIV